MALGRVWRVCSVWLLLTVTLTLGCERLQLLQVLNTETLHKLREMGGPFPRHCVTERLSLKSKPLKLVKFTKHLQIQEGINIVHQTLQQITNVYSMNLDSVAWSRKKVEHFRLFLDRQLRELEACIRKPSSKSRSRGKDKIRKYFKKLRKFLKQKGAPFPWQCVSERLSLKTQPLKLANLSKGLTTQEKIHIVLQTLQQTNEIYGMSLGSATWPLKKVEDFRVLLHRQARELEECVWNPATESRPKGTIIIEKYFRKLRSFLKHKKFAECAWEIIRAETRACLQQILLITAKTSRKN
ncbi:interferon alpha-1-like [Hypanus sabinus]|uniref:interferon alpha-1-like n=1 Tax=Hypanus sabinus TaxID=79690 RepID=UPI0028C399D2|nr:interferon alpha-1-like [Hypanus sabinus]